MTQELWHLSPKNLGPPNFCVKKLKMKAFQLLLPPLKFALRLLQFGMCIVTDICDRPLLDIFFTFPPAGPQTKGLVKSLDFPTQLGSQLLKSQEARSSPDSGVGCFQF